MIQDIYPHVYSPDYLKIKATDEDYVFSYDCDNVMILAKVKNDELEFMRLKETDCTADDVVFLFAADNKNYFLAKHCVQSFGEYEYISASKLRETKPMWKSFLAITAVQLGRWYHNNRFCGKCAKNMVLSTHERALVCPECKKTVYPSISPSVIVAIFINDKLLLTKYAGSRGANNRYALVAGYIEIGETPEDTVRREVWEEVGLKVCDIKYYKSQPWSFSDSLLFGFTCRVDGSDSITLQEDELSFAGWFKKEDVPENPSKVSLTNEMIQKFRNEGVF